MRRPRHTHAWVTVSVNYQPSRVEGRLDYGGLRGTGAALEVYLNFQERLVYGMTTVTQRCADCAEQHSYVVTGDARIPQETM